MALRSYEVVFDRDPLRRKRKILKLEYSRAEVISMYHYKTIVDEHSGCRPRRALSSIYSKSWNDQ